MKGAATALPGLVLLWSIVAESPAAAPLWRTSMPEKVTVVVVAAVNRSPELWAIGTSNQVPLSSAQTLMLVEPGRLVPKVSGPASRETLIMASGLSSNPLPMTIRRFAPS